MAIEDVLLNMKINLEQAIRNNGTIAQTSLIRSQKLINLLHNEVKLEFIKQGIKPDSIYPAVGKTKPELKLSGLLKHKSQDICILPDCLASTLLDEKGTEKIITINVRSQLSSMAKNIDTLFERTFAEALNLHLKHPKQCLGEVYLIPTHEYCSEAMKKNIIDYKQFNKLEDYINKFQLINNRTNYHGNEYKYERVCLLIADFRQTKPKLYSQVEELKKDGLISKDSKVTMQGLTFEDFAKDLLALYKERFSSSSQLLNI